MKDGRLVLVEWEGRRRPRRDVILELAAAGVPVADIARRLDVRYQIVYMTLHPQPSASTRSRRTVVDTTGARTDRPGRRHPPRLRLAEERDADGREGPVPLGAVPSPATVCGGVWAPVVDRQRRVRAGATPTG